MKMLIEKCPRCEGRHTIEVHEFERGPLRVRGLKFPAWAQCPRTSDPILVAAPMGAEEVPT